MIYLKHPILPATAVPSGFSWTVFLFGWLALLIRGQYAWGAGLFVMVMLCSIVHPAIGLIVAIVMQCAIASLANDELLRWHLANGWRIANPEPEHEPGNV
jgi:Zn-dependent membrane protease YugP